MRRAPTVSDGIKNQDLSHWSKMTGWNNPVITTQPVRWDDMNDLILNFIGFIRIGGVFFWNRIIFH